MKMTMIALAMAACTAFAAEINEIAPSALHEANDFWDTTSRDSLSVPQVAVECDSFDGRETTSGFYVLDVFDSCWKSWDASGPFFWMPPLGLIIHLN